MTSSIQLFDAAFGHVSILNVVSDLVTHAHEEVHIIMWLAGDGGEMTVGDERIVPGRRIAVGVNSLEPHRHYFPAGGSEGKFLAFYIDPDWVAARRSSAREDRIFARSAIRIDNRLNDLAFALLAALTDSDTPGHLAEYEIERFIDSVLDAALAQRQQARGRIRTTARDTACARRCTDEGQYLRAHLLRRGGAQRRPVAAAFLRAVQGADGADAERLLEHAAHGGSGAAVAVRPEEPLISVACNLGFTTQGNFSRFFRDHVGVPPTIYREAGARCSAPDPAPSIFQTD